MYLILLLISISLSFSTLAKELSCSHPAVCQLIKLQLDQPDIKVRPILKTDLQTNLHHFRLSSSDAKRVLSATHLFVAPREVNKEVYKLARKRKSDVFYITLKKNIKRSQREHFWLTPLTLCEAAQQIKKSLVQLSLKTKEFKCSPLELEQRFQFIAQRLHKEQLSLIFGHNALEVLCKKFAVPCYAIESHGHGENSSSSFKAIAKILKKNKAIYIEEPQIRIPNSLKNYFENSQPVRFTWNPVEAKEQPALFALLDSLEKALP